MDKKHIIKELETTINLAEYFDAEKMEVEIELLKDIVEYLKDKGGE